METALNGAAISAALIIAIGSQNAFVLKCGLSKNNVFVVCAICFVCDFILMSVGVMGLGSVIASNAIFAAFLACAGAVFLFLYGCRSFNAAFRSVGTLSDSANTDSGQTARTVAVTALAMSLLNPHVYLDTVVIIGGIAGTLGNYDKMLFLMGALMASFLWFFSLGYGARVMLPLFRKPLAWRCLELGIGCTMWLISLNLALFVYSSV